MTKQDELNAAREARAKILGGGISEYQTVLGGRTVYLDLAALNSLISQLEGEVAIELNAEGGCIPGSFPIGMRRVM